MDGFSEASLFHALLEFRKIKCSQNGAGTFFVMIIQFHAVSLPTSLRTITDAIEILRPVGNGSRRLSVD